MPDFMQLVGLANRLSQGVANPMALMNNMLGNNPTFQFAMKMGQGKNIGQIQQLVRNVAHERGMDEQQLNQFLSNFGLKF